MSFSVYNVRKRSPRGVLCLFQGILDLKRDAFSSPGDAPFRGNRFNSTRKIISFLSRARSRTIYHLREFSTLLPSLSLSLLFCLVSLFRRSYTRLRLRRSLENFNSSARHRRRELEENKVSRFFLDEFVRGVQR